MYRMNRINSLGFKGLNAMIAKATQSPQSFDKLRLLLLRVILNYEKLCALGGLCAKTIRWF